MKRPAAMFNISPYSNSLTHEMRVWYNSGLNGACVQEIRELLASFVEETEVEEEGKGSRQVNKVIGKQVG